MKNLIKNSFAIKRYKKLMEFGTWLQNIPNKLTPPPFRLIQIGMAFWQSRALYVATKLKIADELSDSELSTHTLADRLHLNEDHLYRLMRMLGSMNIFTETKPRIFKNSKLSNHLQSDHPKSVRDMILMHNSPEMIKPWTKSLEDSIRDGAIPFEKTNGMDLFEYMDANKDFDLLFSQAMNAVENVAGTPFIEDINWGVFDRIIDVGGSNGSKSLSILKANLRLKALVFDRPQIIEQAKASWKENSDPKTKEALSRITFVSGSALESIPIAQSDNDAYFFMAVFHTFNNSDCKKILSNLKTAMDGRSLYTVIGDAVADEMNIDTITASMDMQMLMGTKGRERTLSEWKKLFDESGFKIVKVMDIRTFAKYIVIKPIS